MPTPTLFSPLLNWNIEYNGYKFGPRSKVSVSVRSNHDTSGRIEISKTYMFRVTSYIVPRRPIPGDTNGTGIQIPEPLNRNVPFPSIDPFMAIATTDSEMKILLCRLLEQGKTFRYTGQGLGDIYVNTINPNTQQFVQDLDFGPKCRINVLRPVGFNKAWYIEWELETTIMSCCGNEVIDFSNPARRIQEFNYAVNYTVDATGMQRRTISGVLKIIPPIYRGTQDLSKLGEYQDVVSDNARSKKAEYEALLAVIAARAVIINTTLETIGGLNAQIDEILNAAELPVPAETALLIDNLIADRDAAQAELVVLNDQQTLDVNNATALLDIINSLKKVDFNVHTSPAQDISFPSFPDGFDRRQTFGPLNNDNVGNIRLYETVDQYVNIIEERIRIPFGFRRVHRNFDIHTNKRELRFTLVDSEDRWHYSFVPGYADVQISQHTRSVQSLFKWASTITGKFVFPKFLNVPKGVNFSDTGYSKVNYSNPDAEYEKIIPNKTVAMVDFMKVVNQRFALALVAMSHLKTLDAIPLPAGAVQALKERRLSRYAILPTGFAIDEDITGPDIAFSITYTICGPLTKILQLSGHGLPCIIGSDLDATESLKKAAQAASRLQANAGADLRSTLQYANVVFFSNYTNIKKHEDWLKSQKYGPNSAKGGMPLVLDRTYDKILNICHVDTSKTVTDNIAQYDFIRPIANKDQIIQNFQTKTIDNEKDWFPDYQKGDEKTPEEIARDEAKYDQLTAALKQRFQGRIPLAPYEYLTSQIGVLRLISRGDIEGAKKEGFTNTAPALLNASWELSPGGGLPVYLHRAIWSTLFAGLDTDIMLEDNKNSIFSILQDNLRTNLAGTDSYITMPQNFTSTDSDIFAFQRPLEDDIFIEINNLMSNIRPENSWIMYQSEMEIVTQNHRIRHKLLPKQDMAPRSGSNTAPTLIENNAGLPIIVGGDYLVGESAVSVNFLENYPNDDIIQTVGSPSTKIILRGKALRAVYQIAPPSLMTLGGQKANQTYSRIVAKYLDAVHAPVFYCEWEREYLLPNTPLGELAVPENPLFIDPEYISDYELETKDFDRYILQDFLAADELDTTDSGILNITRGS